MKVRVAVPGCLDGTSIDAFPCVKYLLVPALPPFEDILPRIPAGSARVIKGCFFCFYLIFLEFFLPRSDLYRAIC